jgi:nucleoid-associated protein YgaU
MASLTAPARPSTLSRPKLRLTRRGRRLVRSVVLLTAVLLALVGFIAGQGAVSSAGATDGGPATTQVVVQPGQTLWGIAAVTLPGDDTREAVRRIADLNNIDPAAILVPGQALVLPVVE